jgi:hypothetical protein
MMEESLFSERELEKGSFLEKRIEERCLCKRMMEEGARPFLRLYRVG